MQQIAQVISQSGADSYWQMATEQTNISKTLIQLSQQQQSDSMASVDVAPPAQAQFEDDFNDALATGQSVGQFLSSQPPDFSRFEIDEPTVQEKRMVQKATVAIKTMSQAQVEESIDNQLDTLADTGGFTDQSVAVFLISNNSDFNQYQDVNLSDRDEFYKNTQVYPNNAPRVDPFGVLRIGGSDTYKDLVDIQWQK
jgi:3-dehydroquinate dehydratase